MLAHERWEQKKNSNEKRIFRYQNSQLEYPIWTSPNHPLTDLPWPKSSAWTALNNIIIQFIHHLSHQTRLKIHTYSCQFIDWLLECWGWLVRVKLDVVFLTGILDYKTTSEVCYSCWCLKKNDSGGLGFQDSRLMDTEKDMFGSQRPKGVRWSSAVDWDMLGYASRGQDSLLYCTVVRVGWWRKHHRTVLRRYKHTILQLLYRVSRCGRGQKARNQGTVAWGWISPRARTVPSLNPGLKVRIRGLTLLSLLTQVGRVYTRSWNACQLFFFFFLPQ